MSLPTPVDRVVEPAAAGTTVTIRVAGVLDGVAGAALVDTLRAELDRGPSRIDIDLAALEGYTEDGLAALASCRELATGLADGLHYRTEGGPGQQALLDAFPLEATLHPEADDQA
jgi:hypothetical protein